MQTTDKRNVAIMVERSVQNGVRHVVCSPGSRNAPIVIACDLHPEVSTHVIHDERSAAFYALGLSIALNEPVAVTCTSGSALLNYFPGVAEAYYQCVPLVVWSADRPEEWVNHGDGQTIVQKEVFKNHIRFEVQLNEDDDDETLLTKIDDAYRSITEWAGPIHFNVPLNEPLYGLTDKEIDLDKPEFLVTREVDLDWNQLSSEWNNAKKKLILCGQLNPDRRVTQLLAELANDSSVLVMVENLSNTQDQKFVHCIDRALNALPAEFSDYEPDLLITFGTSIVSKRIKSFLRSVKNLRHWKVGVEFPEMDTYRANRIALNLQIFDFLNELKNNIVQSTSSNFAGKWRTLDFLMKDSQTEVLSETPFSDLKVFHYITQYLPESCVLHAGNSSVVRYLQLFDPIKNVKYHCNRGTSGIDGSLSTAVGYASSNPDVLNILLIGDISFFYDSNGLWNSDLPDNLRIVLINNGGGGIFRYIDGASTSAQLERYFEAKHSHCAKGICDTFGVKYMFVDDEASLEKDLQSFLYEDYKQMVLLEIATPEEINDKVLRAYFNNSKKLIKQI